MLGDSCVVMQERLIAYVIMWSDWYEVRISKRACFDMRFYVCLDLKLCRLRLRLCKCNLNTRLSGAFEVSRLAAIRRSFLHLHRYALEELWIRSISVFLSPYPEI